MDYAAHTMPSYQHLQDSASPAHLGSKHSEPHHAGGDAGWKVGAGKPTKNDNMGSHKESKGPGGMDM